MKMSILLLIFLSSQVMAQGAEIKVSVKGMVCGFCAQGIIKKFQAEPSVAKVAVSLEKKRVTLDLKEGQNISDSQIEEILRNAGYNVDNVDRSAK